MTDNIIELNLEEVDLVAGGPLPLLLIAFAKGALTGATAMGLGIAALDALDIVDAF